MLGPLILFAVLLGDIEAYPSGAPVTTCSTLTPVHSGAQVQRSSSPYEISVNKIGNKLKVRIFSPIGEEFRGFIIQARSSRDRRAIIEGKFSQADRQTKAINCFSGIENTLTHADRNKKNEIQTEFTPSVAVNFDEDVIFTATVLKTYNLFWTINTDVARKTSQSGSLPSQSQQHDSTSIYHNCFTEKGCFGLPRGCVTSSSCDVLLSYTSTGKQISFKLHSRLEKDYYMAMALSLDDKMGEDAVIACYRKESAIEAEESYNRGRRNFPNSGGLSRKYDTKFDNGMATCSFLTNYRLEAENHPDVFDLENNTYHLLLAHGPYDVLNKRLGFHSSMISSAERVNFTSFESISAKGVDDAIKVHGAFMATAWIGLVSLGILMARHFKTAFHEKKIGGVLVWFAIHRIFMISALIFILIAAVVIFVYKDGWNYATSNPHAYFGVASSILAVIQPIMAAFRPAADHKKRPIFNWLHFACGNLAFILAMITMFLAVSLESSGLKDSFYYALSIFVILHIIFHVIFQIHTLKSSRSKDVNNEVKMLDMSRAPARNNTMQNNTIENKTHADVCRILLLGLYSIFVIIILMTMYSLIGVA